MILGDIAARVLYLILIVWLWSTDPYAAGMHLAIFFVTLPLAWLGRTDARYIAVDVFLLGLTAVVPLLFHVGIPVESSYIGIDKLFHVLGGMGVAAFAVLYFRSRVQPGWTVFFVVLCTAVAVGAAWELAEWLLLLLRSVPDSTFSRLYVADTMLDLIADALGALLVAGYVRVRETLHL